MRLAEGIMIDSTRLADLCQRHGIARLALFGSALRDDLRPDSDIDLLVEFEPGRTPGLLGISTIELELCGLLGRDVDLRTASDLSRHFRDRVSQEARVVYDPA